MARIASCARLALVLAVCGFEGASRAADPAPFVMNDEVRTAIRGVRGIAVAPDGRSVVAAITETTANGGLPHLWLLAPKSQPRQLTFRTGERGESDGTFAPDGSILFLATMGGTRSLYRLPADSGEPDRLQFGKTGSTVTAHWGGVAVSDALSITGYAASPDGHTLAVWADDAEALAVKARRERKDDGYAHDIPDRRKHLYLVDFATGAARMVPIDGAFTNADWSYDSADLIVTTDPNPTRPVPMRASGGSTRPR